MLIMDALFSDKLKYLNVSFVFVSKISNNNFYKNSSSRISEYFANTDLNAVLSLKKRVTWVYL